MTEEQGTNTPSEAEQTDTTPPQAETKGTTQAAAENAAPQADIDKIVQKRLDRERKKWEAERAEAERLARMDEAERLKEELAKRDKAIAEREAEIRRERTLRTLTGKVVNEEAAYKLLDDTHLDEDGNVNLDAFLESYPFLKPAPQQEAAPERPRVPPANATKQPGTGDLSPQDFKGKPIEWARQNLHRLKG